MSNTSQIFIIRSNRRNAYVLDRRPNAYFLTKDIDKSARFTMPEARKWIEERSLPNEWMIEYAPLREGVKA